MNTTKIDVNDVWDCDENQKQINDESIRNFESIIELKNYLPRINKQTVSVKSRLPPNFSLKNPYAGGGEFQYIADSLDSENGGTVFSSNVANGKWHRIYSSDVYASWFCGFGGINNDVTVSMQQAIDFTNSINNASAICIDDKFLISSSLMIDRKTDTTHGDYIIYANGNNNGFLINTPITMFSSRLDYLPADAPAYSKAACSEFTVFKGIDFESTIQHVDSLVFDDKFLRLTFDSCTHRKIQAIKDAEYLQTVRWINNCKHRQHVGFFVNVVDAYDCRVSFSQFENSAAGFNFRGIARGCHFNDTLYQGSTGPFVRAAGLFGGSIDRNYFEQNLDAEIVLGVADGVSSGYTINSNIFMLREDLASDNTFFPIQVGVSRGFALSGNTSTGNLANTNNASLFEISESGNAVPIGKLVMSLNANTPLNLVPAQSVNQAGATLIRHKINIISSSSATNASVKLSVINTFINGSSIKISNDTDNGLYIYPNINERILGVGYNLPHLIGARSKIELAKSDSDYWTII